MLKLIGRRLLWAIPTLYVVVTLSFGLIKLVPGDPAFAVLGQTASQAEINQLHHRMGLDRPLLVQYWEWIVSAVRGDFGMSLVTGRPVLDSLRVALPATMWIAIITTLISLAIGVFVGVVAAVRRGTFDTVAQWIASLGLAIPNFWAAYALVVLFALNRQWLPATGYAQMSQGIGTWLSFLLLPSLAIAISNICTILLQTRSSVLDILSRDFVRTLQATGIRRSRILFKHVLRNASIPVAVVTGISFIGIFSGVVVIEAIFAMPGLGNLLLKAVAASDFPVVQGTVVFFAMLVIAVNLAVDVVTGLLDPRVRVS